MKHIDDHYKDWCGEHHTTNSCHPVHDSTETIEFAEYYYKEITGIKVLYHPCCGRPINRKHTFWCSNN